MLLETRHLKKHYPIRKGFLRKTVGLVKAVDDISFFIARNEVVGLVGESGSGKSTAALCSIQLITPSSGDTFFNGESLPSLIKKNHKALRQKIGVVFQDPYSSLSPRKNILENMGEALIYHGLVSNQTEKREWVVEVLTQVGLTPDALYQYPHQFSGGQRQRIAIGRAIMMRPQLVVCDEVLSALDLSLQAQVLNLLHALKKKYKFSILFISHDLSVVRYLCDRIYVMHKGVIVESGDTGPLFKNPTHPYTQKLFASVPKTRPATT